MRRKILKWPLLINLNSVARSEMIGCGELELFGGRLIECGVSEEYN
jgi:hypothetical protein